LLGDKNVTSLCSKNISTLKVNVSLEQKKVIISQSLDDWAYLLWVDKAEKVHPREKPLLLLLPAFDKSLVALDGEEAPLVEVGGGPPPWVKSVQDFLCKLVMKI
jgi:hypothetical protein